MVKIKRPVCETVTPLKDRVQFHKSKDPTRLHLIVAAFLLSVSDFHGNMAGIKRMRPEDEGEGQGREPRSPVQPSCLTAPEPP